MTNSQKPNQERLQRVRGTQDLMPPMNAAFRNLEDQARKISSLYGYGEIQTPLFEFSEVFYRTLGETSDVVHKETYTFIDRGGDSLTLRPEGTAGIARAFISEGLAQNLPLKFFYSGPMFRHERPQKGRYRQFHQIGVECLGQESPEADVESIALAWNFLTSIGLNQRTQLEINTLGDTSSRLKYREKLVEYFLAYKTELSSESQMRLEKNPLRILDSKDAGDQKINATAPRFEEFLNDESKKFFDSVLHGLHLQKIPLKQNSHLVRGLDYYSHTVFEFVTSELGAQGTVLAGGRYDGLIALMGGPQTPGVGWAAGIERLCELSTPVPLAKTQVCILPADEKGESYASFIAQIFRAKNLRTEILFSGNISKKMKKASQLEADYAVIIGTSEIEAQSITLKNLKSGTQQLLPWSEIHSQL